MNLRLVISIAKKCTNRGLQFLDLIQQRGAMLTIAWFYGIALWIASPSTRNDDAPFIARSKATKQSNVSARIRSKGK